MLHGIDHVQLAAPAGCEEDARRFFGDGLGLTEVEKPEPLRSRGGLWFQCGAQQVHIGVEQEFSPARKAHPAFQVVHYDALLDRLRTQGIDPTADDSIPGLRRSFVDDPWGNRIELLESLT